MAAAAEAATAAARPRSEMRQAQTEVGASSGVRGGLELLDPPEFRRVRTSHLGTR